MTMRSLLIPVEDSAVLPSMLAAARLVAERFGGYVEGQFDRPSLVESWGPDGLGSAVVMESIETQDREQADRARALFADFVRESKFTENPEAAARDQPSAGWHDEDAPGSLVVASRGRLFDLIVVGQPQRDALVPRMLTLEAALFETGRPILIAPVTPPRHLGEHVVIAWNGSTETARTLAAALPFLERAPKVTVLSIEDWGVPGPEAPEVVTYLARNGISASVLKRPSNGRSIGQAILEETAACGADLLVKGAYTHSRLRQMIFGGATSHILSKAELPVFMAH